MGDDVETEDALARVRWYLMQQSTNLKGPTTNVEIPAAVAPSPKTAMLSRFDSHTTSPHVRLGVAYEGGVCLALWHEAPDFEVETVWQTATVGDVFTLHWVDAEERVFLSVAAIGVEEAREHADGVAIELPALTVQLGGRS